MICEACKAEFDDSLRFCPRCGAVRPDAFSPEASKDYCNQASQGQNTGSEPFAFNRETEESQADKSKDKPFFVQAHTDNSADNATDNRAANSGSPYAPGYRPAQAKARTSWYTQNKSSSQDTDSTQKKQDTHYSHTARTNSQRAQGAYGQKQTYSNQNAQQAHYEGFPFQQKRTFDDKSVRNFLVGFTIVAVAVVTLVVILVAI